MKAAAIIGSQAFGLNDGKSDVDVKIITKEKGAHPKLDLDFLPGLKKDCHYIDQLTFITHFFNFYTYPTALSTLTSLPLVDEVPIFIFLRENREEYIAQNKQNVYSSCLNRINARSSENHFKLTPKTLTTNIRLLQVLLDYKKTENWGKSFWTPEHLKPFLLETKDGKKDFIEVDQKRRELQEELEKEKDFYFSPINQEYNDWFYQQIRNILEIPQKDFEIAIETIPERLKI